MPMAIRGSICSSFFRKRTDPRNTLQQVFRVEGERAHNDRVRAGQPKSRDGVLADTAVRRKDPATIRTFFADKRLRNAKTSLGFAVERLPFDSDPCAEQCHPPDAIEIR